ncbi:hypothetical protein J8273_4043 [Carpediemonas membranifera]|uniref:Uncharacterized protein n=1 Tax=Carpediemonas membranifera TaxID=201153 RepID=A0A8J6B4Z0_9EUKA|nr:hypothetical protein J8273_4043 [Carpediemonas membranifera]|eukprot:KAG9394399.1 hypothetical protein J8273_4043 [Carpediemonas membranifera]
MWVNVLVITRTNSLVGGVAVRADGGGAILVNYVKIDDNVIPLEKAYYLSRELSIWRARNEPQLHRVGVSDEPLPETGTHSMRLRTTFELRDQILSGSLPPHRQSVERLHDGRVGLTRMTAAYMSEQSFVEVGVM